MQIIVDENINNNFESCIGDISFEKIDAGGRIYIKWEIQGIKTEIGINLTDIMALIQAEMNRK